LKGVKRPDESTPALERSEVERRLLALSGEQVPFTVRGAGDAEPDSDLEAEWRIVDAEWYEVLAESFQGKTFGSKSFGSGYAFTGVSPRDWGQVYNYRFDVSEMKDPIVEVVTGAGWSFVPVTTKSGLQD